MAIHDHGLEHGDFQFRDLLVDDLDNPQRVFIIDFEHAGPHACRRSPIVLGRRARQETFGCSELWDAAYMFCMWTPGAGARTLSLM